MIGWLKSLRRLNAPEPARLLTAGQLQFVIERERMRADRNGGRFSLVKFRVPDNPRARQRHALAEILAQRLRITDDAGPLEGNCVAAVLPDTSAGGAWTVADDVRRAAAAVGVELECEVFEYPHLSMDERGQDGPPQWREPRRSDVAGRLAQPLEALLIQRMPAWKRGLDVACAVIGLVLFSPVLLLAAAAIKLTSPGPVLFKQWRSGLGGRPFLIYKLRTMHCGAERRKAELAALNEQDGPAFKIANDPRVTRVGRLLRRTCVDELPQLWNVLRGEMSMVGPRPLPVREQTQCAGWERRRLTVTPGLTCIWQVHGGTKVSFAEWMRMDLRYARTRTFGRDLKLLGETALAVLFYRTSG